MLSHRATDYTPFRNTCAPQKVDPALIARVRPTIVGCFWPVFFFADHNHRLCLLFIHPRAPNLISLRSVLPLSSVGKMTLKRDGALSYS